MVVARNVGDGVAQAGDVNRCARRERAAREFQVQDGVVERLGQGLVRALLGGVRQELLGGRPAARNVQVVAFGVEAHPRPDFAQIDALRDLVGRRVNEADAVVVVAAGQCQQSLPVGAEHHLERQVARQRDGRPRRCDVPAVGQPRPRAVPIGPVRQRDVLLGDALAGTVRQAEPGQPPP